jgi:hypothetical protein
MVAMGGKQTFQFVIEAAPNLSRTNPHYAIPAALDYR